MAYQKLTSEQEDQIRSMRKDGKSPQECVDYMKTTYGIDIEKSKISYIVGKGPGGYAAKKVTRKYIHHKLEKAHKEEMLKPLPGMEPAVSIDEAVKDIIKGLQQISAGYNAIFMHLRLAVIREKGKVFAMAKNAGIEIK
jgi:hypothetical protein